MSSDQLATPLSEEMCDKGDIVPAWKLEIRDIARALSGALFVSLPLLYTMEMWQHARWLSDWHVLGMLVASYLIILGMLSFSGFRQINWPANHFWDALIAMGLGALASAVTLFVAGVITAGMSTHILVKAIALETVVTGIGAAVAKNQLGGGDGGSGESKMSPGTIMILGSILGGVLFAFNIAPTMETKIVTLQQNWWLILATMLLSIFVSWMIVEVADFSNEGKDDDPGFIDNAFTAAIISYAISLVIAYALLFGFDFISFSDPLSIWVPQVVTVAYATAIGGAAGRLVL